MTIPPRPPPVAGAGCGRRLRSAYAALALLDTHLAGDERRRGLRRWTKPLLMPALALSLGVAHPPSPLRRTAWRAEAAGWVGDVLLLGSGTRAFAAGAAAFGVGHASYVAGLRSVGRDGSPVGTSAGRAVLAVAVGIGPVLTAGAYRKEPALAPAVAAYATLLATTAISALHLDPTLPAAARREVAAGGVAFLVSDTLLGLREFVIADPPPGLERAVMATYTLAQALLADGLARLGRTPCPEWDSNPH